ncbi:unnamed protein product [Parnassius mnemosyne]|uniref:Uncharacterized protein n=1 Tax=Parnassius mnemosyne TaxID=213953 RepID=A0AAV1M676_9NEOP
MGKALDRWRYNHLVYVRRKIPKSSTSATSILSEEPLCYMSHRNPRSTVVSVRRTRAFFSRMSRVMRRAKRTTRARASIRF